MIGIMCAMEVELKRLKERLENAATERVMNFDFITGRIGGHEVALVKCGVGKVNAAVCCQTLLMRYHPGLVINSGVAGSLNRDLDILDIVVATDVVQHDVDTTAIGDPPGMVSTVNVTYFPCDPAANRGILSAMERLGVRGRPGRVASGEQFVTDAKVKRRIVELFSADACEMEAGAIAQACYIAGVPCAVIRAISDATDNSHQLEFAEFVERAADNAAGALIGFLENLEKGIAF